MYHVEGQKAPLILNMYENDYMWAKNKFGYNIKFCTDCFNEIIFLDKWACTKKLAQPKTFFSSKSWRSFSKERLHTTVTCHCAILRNIEILVYYKGTSFATKPTHTFLLLETSTTKASTGTKQYLKTKWKPGSSTASWTTICTNTSQSQPDGEVTIGPAYLIFS